MKMRRILALFLSLVMIFSLAFPGGVAFAEVPEEAEYVETVAPGCETEGYDLYILEGEELRDNLVPALGHDYQAFETVDPTCDAEGYTVYKCSRCGDEYKGDFVQAGHKAEEVKAVDATCEEDGHEAGLRCAICGEVLDGCAVIPATGHKFEDGKCSVCGAEEPAVEENDDTPAPVDDDKKDDDLDVDKKDEDVDKKDEDLDDAKKGDDLDDAKKGDDEDKKDEDVDNGKKGGDEESGTKSRGITLSGSGTQADPYVVATEDELKAAVAAGGFLRITYDGFMPVAETITLTKDVTFLGGNMTSSATTAVIVPDGVTFTIVGSGTIRTSSTTKGSYCVDVQGGTFNIQGYTFSGHTAVHTAAGFTSEVNMSAGWSNAVTRGFLLEGTNDVVTITGGSIYCRTPSAMGMNRARGTWTRFNDDYVGLCFNGTGATVSISGGLLQGGWGLLFDPNADNSTLNISGTGSIKGAYTYGYGIAVFSNAKLNISGGSIDGPSYGIFDVSMNGEEPDPHIEFNMSGGTVTGQAHGVAFNSTDTVSNVSGTATITCNGKDSSFGFAYGGRGSLTVTGGTFNGKGHGIEMYGSTVNLSIDNTLSETPITINDGILMGDGTLTINGTPVINVTYNDSRYVEGFGITYFAGHGVILRPYTADSSITATINGGTFTSAAGYAVVEQYFNENTGAVSLAINGGTFTGNADKGAVYLADAASDKVSASITKGTFSSDPSAYVAEGAATVKRTSDWVVGKVGTAEEPNEQGETTVPVGNVNVTVTEATTEAGTEPVTIGNDSTYTPAAATVVPGSVDAAKVVEKVAQESALAADADINIEIGVAVKTVISSSDTISYSAKPVAKIGDKRVELANEDLGANPRFTFRLDVSALSGVQAGDSVYVEHKNDNNEVLDADFYTVQGTTEPFFIEVTTSSFSTWDITPVGNNKAAVVHGTTVTQYPTLAQAVSTAGAGDTVVLLADVTEGDIAVDKSLTFDLNGFTLTIDDEADTAFNLNKKSITFTLKDSGTGGAIVSSEAAMSGVAVSAANATFVMESGSIALTGSGSCGIDISKDATVTVNGGSVSADGKAIANNASATVNVAGGDVNGNVAVYNLSGNVNISGGTLTGTTYAVQMADGGLTTISGTQNGRPVLGGALYANAVNLITISAGEFTADPSDYVATGYIAWTTVSATYDWQVVPAVTVTFDAGAGATVDGTNQTVSFAVAKDHSFDSAPTGKGYDVPSASKATAVFDSWYGFDATAQITETTTYNAEWTAASASLTHNGVTTNYANLTAAYGAAEAGDTITLLADDHSLDNGSELTIDKSLTIDGDGFTIYGKNTSNGHNDVFVSAPVGSTVTIQNVTFAQFGNHESTASGHAPIWISMNNKADVVIDNVRVQEFNRTGIFLGGGEFTVSNCTINCEKPTDYGSVMTKGIEVHYAASGTISDTKIVAANNTYSSWTTAGIEIYGEGDVVIDGVEIDSLTNGIAISDVAASSGDLGEANVTVKNSTVNATENALDNSTNGAVMNVESGEFTGNVYNRSANEGGMAVSGGTFDHELAPDYCADGYVPVKEYDAQGEPYYTVEPAWTVWFRVDGEVIESVNIAKTATRPLEEAEIPEPTKTGYTFTNAWKWGNTKYTNTDLLSLTITHNYYLDAVFTADLVYSVAMADWIEGNTASTPVVTATLGDEPVTGFGTPSFKYKLASALDDPENWSDDEPSTAGTYTVKATIPATETYTGDTANANFTIDKAVAGVAHGGLPTYYTTLQAAINAAAAYNDTEGTTVVTIVSTVNDESVKFPATLKNVTITSDANDRQTLKSTTLRSSDGGAVDYENIKIENLIFDDSNIIFTGSRSGVVVYKDWTINNCYFHDVTNTGANAAIHFGTFTANKESMNGFTFTNNVIENVGKKEDAFTPSGLILNRTSGTITVTGNRVSGVENNAAQIFYAVEGTVIDIKNNDFTAPGSVVNMNGCYADGITIKDNNLVSSLGYNSIGYAHTFKFADESKCPVNVSDNYFGSATPTLDKNLTATTIRTEKSGTALPVVAKLTVMEGETVSAYKYFTTFADAVAAANEGDTITLLAALTSAESIDKSITLNVDTFNVAGQITVASGKTLVIEGSGEFTNTPNGLTVGQSLKGGAYPTDVNAYCAAGYYAQKSGDKYVVTNGTAVAKIGDAYYTSLAEAVAGAVDGDEIDMLADLTGDRALSAKVTFPAGVSVTLDLNGFTITNDATLGAALGSNKAIIDVNGTLSIIDSVDGGKIEANSTVNQAETIHVYTGTLNITGASISAVGTGANKKIINVAGGKVTATNATISGTSCAYGIMNAYSSTTEIEVTGGMIYVPGGTAISGYSGKVTVDGAALKGATGVGTNGGNNTIKDATIDVTGTGVSAGGNGTTTITGDSISAKTGITLMAGTLTVTGTTVTGTDESLNIYKSSNANINATANSGTILNGKVYIEGAGTSGTHQTNVNFNRGSVVNGQIAIHNEYNTNGLYGATINIAGIVNGGAKIAIFVSGNLHEGNSAINVEDGALITSTGAHGIALNGAATVNVKPGSEITAATDGGTGIEVRAGTLNVTGGTITGGSGETTVTPNDSGTTTTNAGIAIAQHGTKLPIVVNVKGGTITGTTALNIANPQNNPASASGNDVTVTISGTPDFVGTTNTNVETGYDAFDKRANLTVSGGLFVTEVRVEDCADGLVPGVDTATGKYTVVSGHKVSFDLNGGSGAGDYSTQGVPAGEKATKPAVDPTKENCEFAGWYVVTTDPDTGEETWMAWSFDTAPTVDVTLTAKWDGAVASVSHGKPAVVTYFATLQGALNAAQSGDTVTLLDDYDATSAMYSDDARFNLWIKESITLDLDGHTLSVKGRGVGVQGASSNIDVTVKNGTITNLGNVNGRCIDTRGKLNSLTLDRVTLTTNDSSYTGYLQPLTIGGNQATKATVVIKDSNIIVNNDASKGYAITTFNPVEMTITGSTIKGWANLNIKGPDGSAGSSGSTFTIGNSTLVTKNVYTGATNDFGLIKVEDVKIDITITDCNINVDGEKNTQAIVSFETGALNAVNVRMGEGNVVTLENNAEFAVNNSSTAVLAVSGGTFNKAVPDDCCAEHYMPKDNGSGSYGVELCWIVTFDPMGGTIGTSTDSVEVKVPRVPEQAIPAAEVPTPVKANYVFKEWQLNGAKFDFTTHITADIELDAVYTSAVASITKAGETTYYVSLADAVDAAPTDGTQATIKLIADGESVTGSGVKVIAGKNIVFDLNNKTYNVVAPTVGSTGTETNGFQLLKGSTVTFKDGALESTAALILLQNYSALTLDKVVVNNNKAAQLQYAASNNCGTLTLKNGTVVNGSDNQVAFDVCVTNNYPDGVTVTVEDGATVNGTIEYDVWGTKPAENKTKLVITGGTINGSFAIEEALVGEEHFAVSGGSFKDIVPLAYCAEGFIPVTEKGPDGMYHVELGATITFVNYNGDELDKQDVPKDGAVVYGGATPVKPADAQGVYTWTGWTDGATSYDKDADLPVATTTDVTYTATFSSVASVASLTTDGEHFTYYASLADAVDAAPTDGTQATIKLIADGESVTGSGVKVIAGKNIVFDLNNKTYNVVAPTVGSTGTETNGFQLLKGSTVTFKDGALESTAALILLQNYSALTLDKVVVNNNKAAQLQYAASNNCGTLTLKNGTVVNGSDNQVAFDVCVTNYYPDGVTVTVENGATVNGTIEYDVWGTKPAENKTKLVITGGTINGSFKIEEDLVGEEHFAVSGGSFKEIVPLAYCAEGYIPVTEKGPDGMYHVEPGATITFVNYDGKTVLETKNVKEGGAVAYTGETPVKPADAQGVYTWTGWTDGTTSYDTTATLPVATTTDVTYTATFSSVAPVASITNASGTTYFATLAEAVAAVKADPTITKPVMLLADLTNTKALTSAILVDGFKVTIDMNGHNIAFPTLTGGDEVFSVKNDGELILNNTSKNAQGQPVGGTVTANNTVRCYAIYLYSAGLNKATVGENVTLNTTAGVAVMANDVLDVYGTINSINDFAVTGNGEQHGTTISIYPGAVLNAGTSTAIYNPQDGTLNIYGGTITGETGIELRAGTLNIPATYNDAPNTANITGTGTPASVESNGNGTTTVGAGVAIAQHTTKRTINAEIHGGQIHGYHALYVSNPEGNTENNVNVSVDGGSFTSSGTKAVAVSDTRVTKFISGGTFSDDKIKNTTGGDGLCVDTYFPKKNDDGTYAVILCTELPDHIDENHDGLCDICGHRLGSLVTAKSSGDGTPTGASVAFVSGGGVYTQEAEVTVTTNKPAGYNFEGWYINGEAVAGATTLSYTFIVDGKQDYNVVAVFSSVSGGTFNLTVTGSMFKVSGYSATQRSRFNGKIDANSSVTIEFTDKNRIFMYWINSSNKIVTRSKEYTFDMVMDTELTAVYSEGTTTEALVVFLTAASNGQVMSSYYCTASDPIYFPAGPSSMGQVFKYWSIDGETPATEAAIHSAIAGSGGRIELYPVYESDGKTFDLTVYYVNKLGDVIGESPAYSETGIDVGTPKNLMADDNCAGLNFAYWSDKAKDGDILAYTKGYTVRPTKSVTLYAVYLDAAPTALPTITMTDAYRSMNGTKYRVSFTATRSIPDGYTLERLGILYVRAEYVNTPDPATKDQIILDALVLDSDNGNVKDSKGTSTGLNGTQVMNVNTTDPERVFYARGYIVVRKGDEVKTIYAPTYLEGSYNSLADQASGQGNP